MFGYDLLTAVNHPGLGPVTAAVVALALLLARSTLKSRDRTVPRWLLAYALSFVGLFAAAILAALGLDFAAKPVRWVAILTQGCCVIGLSSLVIFNLALRELRCTPPRIVRDIVTGAAYIAWTLFWLRANRVDPAGIVATSAVITAIVGFSMQDTLGNVLGGIALQFDQSVRVGDWVKVDDQVGRVVEVGWRQTSIETRSWETVVVPNSMLLKGKFLVLGRRQGEPVQLRRTVTFNVDFRYPPTQVIETVEKAVRSAELEGVAAEPAPNCILMDFAESYGKYGLRYWLTDLFAEDPTDSAVRSHIYFALRRANIQLSIPAAALFVTEDTEQRRTMKFQETLARRMDALRRVELFRGVHDDEVRQLAERLVPAPFTRGDLMTRQGATAHWLYLLVDGQADVIVENKDGVSARVAELAPGSVFGEEGLLTGESRSATVVARTDVDCYRLDKESFQSILQARPELAAEISALLARRRVEREKTLEQLDEVSEARRLAHAENNILGQIRRFFGLED